MKLDNAYLLFGKKHVLFWICLPFLYIASFFYCFVVTILKWGHKLHVIPSYRSKLTVISVGNITLGGTGKTPLVEMIVSFLCKKNKKPGIIIRGYKKPRRKQCSVTQPQSNYFQFGDEASMLKTNLSDGVALCVGRDKNKSAKELETTECDVAVVDDGFQHWRLKRDLDIVAVDSTFTLSNQRVLPVGRLREPLSCLRRADIFVLTKTDFIPESTQQCKEELQGINPYALIVDTVYQPLCFFDVQSGVCHDVVLKEFKGKSVLILVGIANPFYFDKLLSGLGLKIVREFIFPDHYEYTQSDMIRIKELADNLGVDTIITTQKDAERLRHLLVYLQPLRLFCLKIQVKITENEEAFHSRLLSVCSR